MPLTKELKVEIANALQIRSLPGSCSVCGQNNWILNEYITYIDLSEPGGPITIGGQSMPCAPLVCNHCGNTLLFNLVVLGVWDKIKGEKGSITFR